MIRQRKETPYSLPNSFRDIDVYPQAWEVNSPTRAVLRKNVVKGPYDNLEHYLDVQFRLIREDFVAPLREGICEYLDGGAKQELSNIKIHKHVCCVGVVPHQGQLGYLLQVFKPKSIADLENSKRFMYGAMVCLIDDRFKSILFGRIIDCDKTHLSAGRLVVALAHNNFMDVSKTYTLAECTVYFEPYFHVLNALKRINKLPMEHYLIHVSTENNIKEFPIFLKMRAKVLGLNSSQQEAYAAALSDEFCIIQGPPGTGKTHLSLNVTRDLILQYHGSGPLLIICCTNHALDQFLEGLLDVPRRLIRVGGQSKNEALKKYSLHQVKDVALSQYKHMNNNNRRNHQNKIFELINSSNSLRYNLNTRKDHLRKDADLMGVISKLIHVINFDYCTHKPCNTNCTNPCLLAHGNTLEIMRWLLTEAPPERKANRILSTIDDTCILRKSTKEKLLNAAYLQYVKNILQGMDDHTLIFFGTLSLIRDYVMDFKLNYTKQPPRKATTEIWKYMSDYLQKHLIAQFAKLVHSQQQYHEAYEEYRKITDALDLHILRNAEVIGMTTTSAARLHNTLQQLGCQVVIIEEAAECLEAHIVAALNTSCRKLILVGDHKQLRPKPSDYKLAQKYQLDISLFERMINNGVRYNTLDEQHRMRPEIASLISPSIYPTLKNAAAVLSYPAVRGISESLYFITHQHREEASGDSSQKNIFEAEYLVRLAIYLVRNQYDAKQITMLAAYSAQSNEMQTIKQRYSELDDMRISTLDNYQGEENHIILLSLVRNNATGANGFLEFENRVCVALSRARHGLYIMGNMPQLERGSSIWRKVSQALQNNGSLGHFLTVHCVNHTSSKTYLREIVDFDILLSSGCKLKCGKELGCRHKCNRQCHMDNTCRCKSTCNLLCQNGHPCPKPCEQPCGDCVVTMKLKFSSCGHIVDLPCNQVGYKRYRSHKVLKTLPCGHSAMLPCNQVHEVKCHIEVIVSLPCGHQIYKPCYAQWDYFDCGWCRPAYYAPAAPYSISRSGSSGSSGWSKFWTGILVLVGLKLLWKKIF